VQLSCNGMLVAAGGDDDTAHVWRVSVDETSDDYAHAAVDDTSHESDAAVENAAQLAGRVYQHFVLKEHVSTVFGIDISPDLKFLVTGCSGERLKVWLVDDLNRSFNSEEDLFRSVYTKEEAHDLGVTCCAFHPNTCQSEGYYVLATGGNDALIKIWRISNPGGELKLKHSLSDHGSSIMALRYSVDGDLLGSCSVDKTARVWSTITHKCIAVLDQHPSYVSSCAFSGDSSLFVSCSENYVSCWRLPRSTGPDDDEIKMHFLGTPIQDWSGREVLLWLETIGVQDKSEFFANSTGKTLLKLTQDELLVAGYTDEVAHQIRQNVQWKRHGNIQIQRSSLPTIPAEFICPITHEVMEEPVLLADGFVYEEIAIKEWLTTRKQTSPMTNLALDDVTLVPCTSIKLAISTFLKNQTT